MEAVSMTGVEGGAAARPAAGGEGRPSTDPFVVMDEILAEFIPASPVAQRIVDVTVALIDERGEVAVRVQDIVERAGVQVPILYRHFGSRDGVIQAAHVKRLLAAGPVGWGRFLRDVGGARTAAEFRAIVELLIETAVSPRIAESRAKQVNVFGAVYGRPRLRAAVARMQYTAAHMLAEVFEPARANGWIRADLDLDAFGAWFGSQLLGRYMIELEPSFYDGEAWNRMFRAAILTTLFED